MGLTMEGVEIGNLLGGLLKQLTDEVRDLRAFQEEALRRFAYLEAQDVKVMQVHDDLRANQAKTRRGLLQTDAKVIEDKTNKRMVERFYRKLEQFTDIERQHKRRVANRPLVMGSIFLETRTGMFAKYYPKWARWYTQRRRLKQRLRECMGLSDCADTALRQLYLARLLRFAKLQKMKRAVARQLMEKTIGGARRRCYVALKNHRDLRKREHARFRNCEFLSRFSQKGLLKEYLRKLGKHAVLSKGTRRTKVALRNRTDDLARRNKNVLRKDYYRKLLALQTAARAEEAKRKQRTLLARRFCGQSDKCFKISVFKRWFAFLELRRSLAARRASQVEEIGRLEIRNLNIRRAESYRRMQKFAAFAKAERVRRHQALKGMASLLHLTGNQTRKLVMHKLARYVEHKRAQRAAKAKVERRERLHRGALQTVLQATDRGTMMHCYQLWVRLQRLARKRDLKDEFMDVRLEIRKAKKEMEYELLSATEKFKAELDEKEQAIEESIDPVRFSLAETQRLVVGLSDQSKALANEHTLIREEHRVGLTDAMGEVDEVLSTLKSDVKKLSTNSQHMLNVFRVEVDDSVAEQLQKLEFTMADLLAKDRTNMKEGFDTNFEALTTKVTGLGSQVDVSLKSLSNTNMVLNKVVDRMISVDNTLEGLTTGAHAVNVPLSAGPDVVPKQVSPPRQVPRSPTAAMRTASPPKRNIFAVPPTTGGAATVATPGGGTPNTFSTTRRT